MITIYFLDLMRSEINFKGASSILIFQLVKLSEEILQKRKSIKSVQLLKFDQNYERCKVKKKKNKVQKLIRRKTNFHFSMPIINKI